MYRLVLLKFTVLWKPLTLPLFASPRNAPPPPTPLARQPNNTNLKTTVATMKTLLQKCIRVLFKLNRVY